jgi:hypothetical protein
MNSFKIHLPDFVLTELYKDSIVILNDADTKVEQSTTKDAEAYLSKQRAATTNNSKHEHLSYLGSNKKHISIIVNDAEAIHLQDDLLEILSAILSACKLNLADVAIVNMHKQHLDDKILRNELSPAITILFGVETTAIDLPFSIPIYKPQPFNNCTYMQSVSLEEMRGSSTEAKVEKSKLWVSLKSLFGL